MSLHRAILAAVLMLVTAVAGEAQPATQLYRVFLSDGSTLASFGEWARVDNRVIFSMPVSPGAGPGELHLVSLHVSRVDLARSEKYADAVRAANYAATRGEADFAHLSSTVAQTLNQVALIKDPRQRLAAAEQARRELADWPASHFGYRATEVREIIGVLDEVISELGASAGQPGGFSLALSANTETPPTAPLLPAPTHEDIVQSLMTASKLVDTPTEKVSLLQSVVGLIDRAVGYLPDSIAVALRATALGEIADEQRIDAQYTSLTTTTLGEAARFAERADVRGLERLRQSIRERDAQLGSRRPDHVAGVLATIDAHLDAAHRLRLAQDQWLLAEPGMRAYRRSAWTFIQGLVDTRTSLEDIKLLAGPDPQGLGPLFRLLDRHGRRLALLTPPPQLVAVHAVFQSAYSLATNAVQLRRDAVEAADVDLARQASAAASGALMLLDRARTDLDAALEPPISLKTAARP